MKRLIFCFFLLIFLVGCAEEDLPPAPSPPGGDSGVGRAVGGVQISAQLPAWAASLKYTDIEPASARFGDVIVLTVEKTRDVKKDFLVFSEIYVFNKKVYDTSRVGLWEVAEADSSLSGRITENWAKDRAVFRIPVSSERFVLGQNYVVVYWCVDSGNKDSKGKKIWNCNGNKWGLGAFDVVLERYPSVLAEREIANNVYLSSSRIVSPPDAFTGTIGNFDGMGDSYVGSYKHRAPDEFETEVIITKLSDVDKFKDSLASVVHLLDWVELAGPTCGFESSGSDFVSFSWLSGTYWVTVKTYSDEHNAALIGNYATVYRADCDLLDELQGTLEGEEYCGDGVLQAGEECEPPGTSACDEFCEKITPVAPPKAAPLVCPDAISVWSRADEDVNVWYSEYFEGTKEWAVSSNRPARKIGEAASLAIVPRDDFDPDVSSWPVADTCGRAVVVWSNQPSETSVAAAASCSVSSTVYYSIWDHSNGWTVPAVLSQNGCDPAVAADYSGNSVAVFVRSDGLYASGFNGVSWSAPVSVQKAVVSLPQISWTPGVNNWVAVWESGGKAWFANLNNAGVVLSGPSQLGSAVGGSVALPSKRLSVDSQWSGSGVTAVYESSTGFSYVQLSPVASAQSLADIFAPDVVYDFSDVYHVVGKAYNDLKYFDADGTVGNAAGSSFVDGRPAHAYIPSNVDVAVWHSEDELASPDIYWSRRDSLGWSAAKKLVTGGLADFDKNADIAPLFKAACEAGSFDPAAPCARIIYYRPSQPVPVPAGPGRVPGDSPGGPGISPGADGTAPADAAVSTTPVTTIVATCTSSDQCGAGSGKQCSQGFECVNCKCVEKPVWVKLIDCSSTGMVPCTTVVCPSFTVGSSCPGINPNFICTAKPAGQQYGNYACRLLSEQVQAYCGSRNIVNCNPAVAKLDILSGASVDAGPPAVQPPVIPSERLIASGSVDTPVPIVTTQPVSPVYSTPQLVYVPTPEPGTSQYVPQPSVTPTPRPATQYVVPQPTPRPSGGTQYLQPQPTPYTDVPISSTGSRTGRALFTGESSYSGNAPAMILIVAVLVLLLVLYLIVYRKK